MMMLLFGFLKSLYCEAIAYLFIVLKISSEYSKVIFLTIRIYFTIFFFSIVITFAEKCFWYPPRYFVCVDFTFKVMSNCNLNTTVCGCLNATTATWIVENCTQDACWPEVYIHYARARVCKRGPVERLFVLVYQSFFLVQDAKHGLRSTLL